MHKADFPIFREHPGLRYLDNAATTQKPTAVITAISDFYASRNANTGRVVYGLAAAADEAHECARETVAKFIGVRAKEVVFTSGATEGLNLVAQGIRGLVGAGDEVVVSIAEHHSNMLPWWRASQEAGAQVIIAGYSTEAICAAISSRTKVVAVTMVSNVTGARVDIPKISAAAHQVGAIVVCDGAQAVGHFKVDVSELGVDFFVFSGHKMYGPAGVGVLYGREEMLLRLSPGWLGGGAVERVEMSGGGSGGFQEGFSGGEVLVEFREAPERLEAGTRNVAGEVGLAEAIRYLSKIGLSEISEHERKLQEYLVGRLRELDFVEIYEGGEDCGSRGGAADGGARQTKAASGGVERAGIVAFNVRGVHPHDVATILDSWGGVAVRAGRHCAEPYVRSLGISACLRASFGVYNNFSDVDKLVEGVSAAREIFGEGDFGIGGSRRGDSGEISEGGFEEAAR